MNTSNVRVAEGRTQPRSIDQEARKREAAPWAWAHSYAIRTIGETLGPNALAIYMVLTTYAHCETQECWPSQKRIADESGASERTVRTYLQQLEDNGWIDIDRDQKQHVYTLLNIPAAAADQKSGQRQQLPVSYRQQLPPNKNQGKQELSKTLETLVPDRNRTSSSDDPQPAGDSLPFHAEIGAGDEYDQPLQRADLEDVKVPLSEDERETYGPLVARIWDQVQPGSMDHLYLLTYGERGPGRGKARPLGTEWHHLAELKRTYPWPWLVTAFVIASSKRAPVSKIERFIDVWLEKLQPAKQFNRESLPYAQPQQTGPRLPDPPPGSYTALERDLADEDWGFEDHHWNTHKTNEGKRWTLTKEGKQFKEQALQQMRAANEEA